MAREVVLDANVIVAQLDGGDILFDKARALGTRLREEGAELVILDVALSEAVSVLCRRARERRAAPPDLSAALAVARGWAESGAVRWVASESERLIGPILDIVRDTGGRLNFNDALLAVLQRENFIGDVASFDQGFDVLSDFRRIA
jgi:predicted nucleic acid-binding protein